MKRKSKKFIFIVTITITIVILILANILVYADSISQNINVLFNAVTIKVNGVLVKSDVITYNNTTYVPLRTVSETFNKEVTWDNNTKEVGINDKVILTSTNTNTNPIQPINNNNITSINNKTDLRDYVLKNYSIINTPKGDFKLTVIVFENSARTSPYHYDISLYNSSLFYELQFGTKYNKEERAVINQILKNHQEKLGKDIIKLLPNKKIRGSYFTCGYRYPTIQADYWSMSWHSWQNYSENSYNLEDNNIVDFHWYTLSDEIIE